MEVLRRARQHTLCVSSYILTEVKNTLYSPRLRKKYSYSDDAIEGHLRNIRIFSERIEPKTVLDVCSDRYDNAVLACAVEASADKHQGFSGVRVIMPKHFLELTKP